MLYFSAIGPVHVGGGCKTGREKKTLRTVGGKKIYKRGGWGLASSRNIYIYIYVYIYIERERKRERGAEDPALLVQKYLLYWYASTS